MANYHLAYYYDSWLDSSKFLYINLYESPAESERFLLVFIIEFLLK